MINRDVGFYRSVPVNDLREIIEGLGGQWQEWPGGSKGVIQVGDATIWCYAPYLVDELCTEPGALETLRNHTEHDVVSVISVHVSHGEGSHELATRAIDLMCRKWDGIEIKDEWFSAADNEL